MPSSHVIHKAVYHTYTSKPRFFHHSKLNKGSKNLCLREILVKASSGALPWCQTGWQDWPIFRLLGDCLLRLVFLKITKIAQIVGLLYKWLQLYIIFDKNMVGLHFGRLFYKLIWSPWWQGMTSKKNSDFQWSCFCRSRRFYNSGPHSSAYHRAWIPGVINLTG
jgi:hypothetical protein